MKKSINTKVIVRIVALFLIIGIILVYGIYLEINEHSRYSKVALAEYDSLFSNEAKGKLEIINTVKTATRNPVSSYIYDKKYSIEVFKINLTTNKELKQILKDENKHPNGVSGFVETMIENPVFEMSYLLGKVDTASIVNFVFEGDSIQTIKKNDSLVCYYLKIGKFSVGYNNDSKVDIGGHEVNEGKIPISIIFVKKRRFIYFILMYIEDGKQEMASDILYNIVQH